MVAGTDFKAEIQMAQSALLSTAASRKEILAAVYASADIRPYIVPLVIGDKPAECGLSTFSGKAGASGEVSLIFFTFLLQLLQLDDTRIEFFYNRIAAL